MISLERYLVVSNFGDGLSNVYVIDSTDPTMAIETACHIANTRGEKSQYRAYRISDLSSGWSYWR